MTKGNDQSDSKSQRKEIFIILLIWLFAITLLIIIFSKVRIASNL